VILGFMSLQFSWPEKSEQELKMKPVRFKLLFSLGDG
jgi:hypothetical protein